MNGIRWSEILKELNELSDLHERGASDPAKCREFNSRASIFLDRLEEMGANEIADRVMGILAGCSPKDFSPCERRLCTKGSLERLQEHVKSRLEKD